MGAGLKGREEVLCGESGLKNVLARGSDVQIPIPCGSNVGWLRLQRHKSAG
jgi:hypothetical protein